MNPPQPSILELSKVQLHAMADALLLGEAGAKETAIAFFEQDSEGLWHNRARAMIARRVKNIPITQKEKERLVEAVKVRLSTGKISEQFKDQLKMALFLDRTATIDCARLSLSSQKAHIVKYARWIIEHEKTEPNQHLRATAQEKSGGEEGVSQR